MKAWQETRKRGFEGLKEFTDLAYEFAQDYLKQHTVCARTPEHKLEAAAAMLNTLGEDRINEARVSKLCERDPGLMDIIVLQLDLETGTSTVGDQTKTALTARCRELAEEVIRERTKEAVAGPDETKPMQGFDLSSDLLRKMKELQRGEKQPLRELWDPDTKTYIYDEEAMADVIIQARQAVELVHAEPEIHEESEDGDSEEEDDADIGSDLLRDWRVDFSDCRTKLTRHEVVTILLDTPTNKAAGPDGIPGEILKRYNWELSEVFMEAWEELTESSAGDTTQAFQELIEEMLGRKKWHAAQKVPGANRTEKLRDIDVGNTVRRTIATMLATVLRDVCSREIHEAQQAFLPSRNIMKNTTLLLRTYGDARTASDGWEGEAENREDIPLLLLLLDCSKGYNRMLRQWIIRCLKRAKTPPKIIRLVKRLMINIPILFLNGSEYGTAETDSGLSQGCIAACLLYIIGVDPLIAKLAARKQQHNPQPDTDTDDDGTPRHRPPRSLTPPANVGDSRAHAPAALGGGPDRGILGTPAHQRNTQNPHCHATLSHLSHTRLTRA